MALLTSFRNNPKVQGPILGHNPRPVRADMGLDEVDTMDLIVGLFQAVITVGVIALIIVLVASLFPIVFSLATMMDKRVNNQ